MMQVTIHIDQDTAPTVEDAARATLVLLSKITVGGTLIMEVEDGDDITIVEVGSSSYKVLA